MNRVETEPGGRVPVSSSELTTMASPSNHRVPGKVESSADDKNPHEKCQESSPISVLTHPASVSTMAKNRRQLPPRSSSSSAVVMKKGSKPRSSQHYGSLVDRDTPHDDSEEQENSLSSLRAMPKVVMGDDGAEVTLELTPLQVLDAASNQPQEAPLLRDALTDQTNVVAQVVTPELTNQRKLLPTNSLLDVEKTPSPLPEKMQRSRSLGSHMLCGSSTMTCLSPDEIEMSALVEAPQDQVERTIQMLLGNPMGLDGWCHGWQAWLYFGMEHGEHADESFETKENMKRVLRNRACDLNSRTRRVKVLKEDLSPFDSSPERLDIPVPLSRSFSLPQSRRTDDLRNSSSASSDVSSSVASLGTAVWERVGCGQPDSESPDVLRASQFGSMDDDLCYDSDPEETTRRRSRYNEEAGKDSETFLAFSPAEGLLPPDENKTAGRKLCRPRRLDALFGGDDDHVHDTVQEFMNERFTLVWHRSVKAYSRSKGTPQAMKAWIERGQQLQSTIIQPKFVWRPMQEYEDEKEKLGLASTPSLESIELLDVSRVLEVNRIDRNLYPFAMRNKCFLLETLDRKMMFEASSESERDRIVNNLKLLVARFASKVIVQDQAVLDEFFTSFVSAVPGEAPRWTQESKTLSLL